MGVPGLDTYAAPSAAVMADLLANTNLKWCAVYVAPSPSHQDTSWMTAYPALVAAGWGVMFVHVGRQITGPGARVPVDPGAASLAGTQDGEAAIALLQGLGAAPGTIMVLDIENGPPFNDPMRSYVVGWALVVQKGGYNAGAYCSHLMVQEVHDALVGEGVESPQFWVFKVATTALHDVPAPYSEADPSGCGFGLAMAWQHDQSAVIQTIDGPLTVDLSVALTATPSVQ
jgi:glycoside hydrolase-like protein